MNNWSALFAGAQPGERNLLDETSEGDSMEGETDCISDEEGQEEVTLPAAAAEISDLDGTIGVKIRRRPTEYRQMVEVKCTMTNGSGDEVGSLSAKLIDRDSPGDNFYCVCDSDSQELLDFAVTISDADGARLRSPAAQVVSNAAAAGRGWVLYVMQIDVIDSLRGQDVGLALLFHVLNALRVEYTLAGLFPAPWGAEDKDRRPCTPMRPGSPIPDRDAKIQKIGHQFGRLGFRQVGKTGYMILEASALPCSFTPKPKHDASVPAIVIEEEPVVSDDVKELLMATGRAHSGETELAALHAMVASGADVTASDSMGITALHVAAATANPDAVKLLLDAGADPTAASTDNQTPLGALSERVQSGKDFCKTMGLPAERDGERVPEEACRALLHAAVQTWNAGAKDGGATKRARTEGHV